MARRAGRLGGDQPRVAQQRTHGVLQVGPREQRPRGPSRQAPGIRGVGSATRRRRARPRPWPSARARAGRARTRKRASRRAGRSPSWRCDHRRPDRGEARRPGRPAAASSVSSRSGTFAVLARRAWTSRQSQAGIACQKQEHDPGGDRRCAARFGVEQSIARGERVRDVVTWSQPPHGGASVRERPQLAFRCPPQKPAALPAAGGDAVHARIAGGVPEAERQARVHGPGSARRLAAGRQHHDGAPAPATEMGRDVERVVEQGARGPLDVGGANDDVRAVEDGLRDCERQRHHIQPGLRDAVEAGGRVGRDADEPRCPRAGGRPRPTPP